MSKISSILPLMISYKGRELMLDRPLIMGILNLTPDSFFDGGKYALSEAVAMNRVKEMVEQGADLLDIGAASSRPGSALIDPMEEQSRILPFFEAIRSSFPELWISIDTYNSSTAAICLERGADMVNDISAGNIDHKMFEVVGKMNCPYVLMHMRGEPKNMQHDPEYVNIIDELISFFQNKVASLNQHGVSQIILDPGFGFGKNLEHNFEILRYLNKFVEVFKLPVLAGISRKSMVNKVIGTKPEEALNGTTALHMLALMNGASILRVHDAKEAKQTIQLFEQYNSTAI